MIRDVLVCKLTVMCNYHRAWLITVVKRVTNSTEQTKVSSLHSSMRPSGWGQSVGIPWGDKSLGKNGYIG